MQTMLPLSRLRTIIGSNPRKDPKKIVRNLSRIGPSAVLQQCYVSKWNVNMDKKEWRMEKITLPTKQSIKIAYLT